MDESSLEPSAHVEALEGLERINRISRTARALWTVIERSVLASGRIRILDVACGGGDVVVSLALLARRAGWPVEVDGCDRSEIAVELARERARHAGVSSRFLVADVLADRLPDDYDIIVSTLFLHHLDDADAVSVLRSMALAARQRLVVDDLTRGAVGMLLAAVGSRILSRSSIVHVDAIRSVRAAYTVPEALDLALRAGLREARIRKRWPRRWTLIADGKAGRA